MLIQKHISEFQITMHNTAVVHVLYGGDDLGKIISCFGFRKAFSTFQEIHHVL